MTKLVREKIIKDQIRFLLLKKYLNLIGKTKIACNMIL